jgi:Ni/Fe-hydrogenase 1 B-type cytochrome subunit
MAVTHNAQPIPAAPPPPSPVEPVPVRAIPDGYRATKPVYVWTYPLRLVHWGMVLALVALGFTGYYIHDPFIIGQSNRPFLMGWFRFAHEVAGMLLIAVFLLRAYLLFGGNRWMSWRVFVPRRREHFAEMREMAKFYLFLRPEPVSRISHNKLAALSYVSIYGLVFLQIVTGLTLYDWLRHSPLLHPFFGWIPGVISLPYLRLIHFFVMFLLLCFAILHVHISMLISRQEKKGLLDSIFTGYKIIPAEEIEEDERRFRENRA